MDLNDVSYHKYDAVIVGAGGSGGVEPSSTAWKHAPEK